METSCRIGFGLSDHFQQPRTGRGVEDQTRRTQQSQRSSTDIESCLTEMEQQLCKLFHWFEIASKHGRTVQLLMDGNIYETLVLLNRQRGAWSFWFQTWRRETAP